MNPVIKGQLNQFQSSNKNEKLSDSDAFEVLAIHAIENGILTENIDPFSAHLRGTEFGIDGVAILIQGELCRDTDEVHAALSTGKRHEVEFHFFQAKTSQKVDYGELSKFFDAVHSFFDDTFVEPTEQLKDLLSAKNAIYEHPLKSNPNVRLFFAHTGSDEPGPQSKNLVLSTSEKLNKLSIFGEVEILILSAKEIQEGYRSATNSISESVEIQKYVTLPDHPSVSEAFIGFISAEELRKLITVSSGEHGDERINRSVFYDNIRDYDPKSEINREILGEIANGAQPSFIFKNNGITVVAKEISRTADKFHLDDYQIVNGCQTSNIIFEAGPAAKGVSIPFRLIGSKDSEFVSSIIVGTNRQNQVRDDQFWALKPFMKDLEEFCRAQTEDQKIFVERRDNQYRDDAVERTRILRPSELMKSIAAMFLFQPHRAARDYRGIRAEFEDKIFQEDHSVEVYHAAALANYKFDFAIRNKRVKRDWKIFKYFSLYALGYELTGGKDISQLSKKKQSKLSEAILEHVSDEPKFVQHITDCAHGLEKLVAKSKAKTREQVRDYLRGESVTKLFIEEVYG